MQLKKLIPSILRKVWYLIAFIIVIMAIMVTLARALTPLLNQHRHDFEIWASQFLNKPVQIRSVKAWWSDFDPDLKLENVKVFSSDKKQQIVSIREIKVNINILKSLLDWRLVPDRIEISGVHLKVSQSADMHFQVSSIMGLQNGKPSDQTNLQSMIQWLLMQHHIILTHAKIDWRYQDGIQLPLYVHRLDFLKQENLHYVSGRASIKSVSQSDIQLAVLLKGDIRDQENLQASVYAKFDHFDLSHWLTNTTFYKLFQIKSGYFDGQIWLMWAQNHIQSVQILYQLNDFKLTALHKRESYLIHHVAGNLLWSPDADSWKLLSTFEDLDLQSHQSMPGVKHVAGNVRMDAQGGQLTIDSNQTQFDFGKLFPATLSVDFLKGYVLWHRSFDQSWIITGHHISAVNHDAAVSGQFGLIIPHAKRSPLLSVLAGYTIGDSSQAKKYLPVGIFENALKDWLNKAFVSGKGGSGTVVLRGPIERFPYDHEEGTFIADAHLQDLNFNYAPNWPMASHMDAHLIFKNRSMFCKATKGQIYNAQLSHAFATIPVIGKMKIPAILKLNIGFKSDASNVLKYIQDSPLKQMVGNDLKYLTLQGKTQVGVSLSLPLESPEKVKVKGAVLFTNTKLQVPMWRLKADQLNGKILFTENALSSETLKANLFGEPTTFNIKTVKVSNGKPFAQINLKSHVKISNLEKYFNWPSTPYIQGDANYQATLNLRTAKDDNRQTVLMVSSNLYGVKVNLPSPINKLEREVLPFSMRLWLGGNQPQKAKLVFGERFSVALLYRLIQNKSQLLSANIHLGSSQSDFSQRAGLWIGGYLPTFDWQLWQRFLKQPHAKNFSDREKKIKNIVYDFFKSLDVTVGHIDLFGQPLQNARVILEPLKKGWQFSIDSVRIAGQVVFEKNWRKSGIVGKFERLLLQSIKKHEQLKIKPASIPILNITADNFQYGDQYFGRLHLMTFPTKNALVIKRCIINSPLLSGDLTGSWHQLLNGAYHSEMIGEMHSNNIDKLLKSWKIHSSLVGTQGNVNFNLAWPGAIYSFKLKNMTGNINFKLKKGWIVDLGEETNSKLNLGRVLTLLSIHRLLVMNFEDLTHSGFGFDKMHSHLRLQNGRMRITRMYFDGSVARINVLGEVNLINKLMNLNLQVTPYLTSSLPIVATIAGGPIVGAVTWVASKILSKPMGKFITYDYKVSGSWIKPVIKEIKS